MEEKVDWPVSCSKIRRKTILVICTLRGRPTEMQTQGTLQMAEVKCPPEFMTGIGFEGVQGWWRQVWEGRDHLVNDVVLLGQ